MKRAITITFLFLFYMAGSAQKYTPNPGYFESDGLKSKFFLGAPHTRDTSHVAGKPDSTGALLVWRDSLYIKGTYAWINVSKTIPPSALNYYTNNGSFNSNRTVTGVNGTYSLAEDSLASITRRAYKSIAGGRSSLDRLYPDSLVSEYHNLSNGKYVVIKMDSIGLRLTSAGSGPGADPRNAVKFTVTPNGDISGATLTIAQMTASGIATFNGTVNTNGFLLANNGLYLVSGGFHPTVTHVTTDYTALFSDYIIQCENTSNITVTLPTSGSIPSTPNHAQFFYIKKALNNLGTVTINTADGSTIDGGSTLSLISFPDYVAVYYDGTNWFTISPGF